MKKLFIFFFAILFLGLCGCAVNQKVRTADKEIKKTSEVYSLDYVFDNPDAAKDELNNLRELVESLDEKEKGQLKNYDKYVEIYRTYQKYQKITETQDKIAALSDNFSKKLSDNLDETKEKLDAVTDSVNVIGTDDAEMYLTNYDKYEQMLTDYKNYVEEEERRRIKEAETQKYFDAAIEFLKAEVPSQWVFEHQSCQMNLPPTYKADDGTNVSIQWESSLPHTISPKGLVIAPRKKTVVKLTATLTCSDVVKTFTRNVVVASIGFKPLPAKPVIAYFYLHQGPLNELQAKTIDVIILSFGSIDKTDGSVHVTRLNTEDVLLERMKGIRVCFSVNDKSSFQLWTSTPEKAKKLASEFVKTIEEYHFDGVDIDWEFPNGKEVANFVTFVKELYTQAKQANPNYLVTAAMAGGYNSDKYNVKESSKYLDYINLMTYDLNSSKQTTHSTALGGSAHGGNTTIGTVKHYIDFEAPKEKLIVGGAFFGKYYRIPNDATQFYYINSLGSGSSISYSVIRSEYLDLIGKEGGDVKVERVWDEDYMAPYLEITRYEQNGDIKEKAFITYDDQESIRLKSEYVMDQGLGGIMFWELGQDSHTDLTLIEPIYDVFKKPR